MGHIKADHSDIFLTVLIVITSYQQQLHFKNFFHNPFQTLPSQFSWHILKCSFWKHTRCSKNTLIVHLSQAKVHPDQYLVLDDGQQVQIKTNSQLYSWKTVTADLMELIWSSKQGSVSMSEMPEAQQARCVSHSNSRKALCKYSAWEGWLYMAHVTEYSRNISHLCLV